MELEDEIRRQNDLKPAIGWVYDQYIRGLITPAELGNRILDLDAISYIPRS